MKADGFYVYKYVSEDGRIVYIGKSESVLQRIDQHRSFKGIDGKFKKYATADIYVHRCSSRHEMDALEVILIEKYKPELNVSTKTDNALSFSFDAEIEWTPVENVRPRQEKEKVERSGSKQERPGKNVIRSEKAEGEFLSAVFDWHTLYYFINWLDEQADDDERATITFSLTDAEESSKWVWTFDDFEALDDVRKSKGIELVYLKYRTDRSSGIMAITLSTIKEKGQIWIDLHYPVNVLKIMKPLLLRDLESRRRRIEEYEDIDEKHLDKCKENGFYDFFMDIRFNVTFPKMPVTDMSEEESEMIRRIADTAVRSVKHTSPHIDFSKVSKKKALNSLFGLFDTRTKYIRAGGAYWNVWGLEKIA